MALKITVISIFICLICFSITKFKADVDMKTARRWFGARNFVLAFHYNHKAITWNPVEMQYKNNLKELEGLYLNLLQSNPIKK